MGWSTHPSFPRIFCVRTEIPRSRETASDTSGWLVTLLEIVLNEINKVAAFKDLASKFTKKDNKI